MLATRNLGVKTHNKIEAKEEDLRSGSAQYSKNLLVELRVYCVRVRVRARV